MIKRLCAAVLALILMMTAVSALAGTVIYKGEVTKRYPGSTTFVYARMDKESTVITQLNTGKKLEITAIYPGWVEVNLDGRTGYILRNRVDVLENLFPGEQPDYPTVQHHFYAVIDRNVDVKAEKDHNSETLSSLTPGARVAIIGVEDGWAVLIYHKQYGYIDTNELSELLPVAPSEYIDQTEQPISVFTSFYNTNVDRINNLAVACKYMSKVLQPGEQMNFNDTVGPFSPDNGYLPAIVLLDGETKLSYGGGSCQVSSTLWNTLTQLPGITILMRKPHGANGASYLPHGMDASSGRDDLNLIFRNDYDFPIRIDAGTHDYALFVSVYRAE